MKTNLRSFEERCLQHWVAALGVSVLLTLQSSAADPAASRSVAGTQKAAGAAVTINQIDTSSYPKVTIFATVTKDGVPLKALTAADFRVREDEVDQEPLTVVPKLTPLSAIVALDTSGSMKKTLPAAKSAAKSFIEMLDASDRVYVVGFAREVHLLSDRSGQHAGAQAAIDTTLARGDTALYDALYTSVYLLQNIPGRKAIALLSDGADDNGQGKPLSQHTVADALDLARKVNVPIFTIGLGTQISDAVLQQVASATGGECLIAPQAAELKAMYTKIGQQLAGQYNIFYTSNLPGDGSSRRVQLTYGEMTGLKEYTAPVLVAPPPAATPVPMAARVPVPPPAPPEPSKRNIFVPAISEVIAAPNNEWEQWLNYGDVSLYQDRGTGVFGLKHGATAKLDAVRVCILETQSTNIRTLELSVADSPTGPFKTMTTASPANLKMVQSGGWQEFKFEPVITKFYRLRLTGYSNAITFQRGATNTVEILGELVTPADDRQASATASNANAVNLFSPAYSEVAAAPDPAWDRLLSHGSVSLYHERGAGVYRFKDGQSATLDGVRVRIVKTSPMNIKTLELAVADDPAGPFKVAVKVTPENLKLVKTEGWQEVSFAPVSAKCYRLTFTATSNVITFQRGADNAIEVKGVPNP